MIDTSIKMYTDANGKDPDTYSRQLAIFHQRLWSKPCPNGEVLHLTIKGRSRFSLIHQGTTERFVFKSDSIGHTMSRWKKMEPIMSQLPKEEIQEFFDLASTIGGYIIFPSKQVDKKPTINAIRGMNPKIKDRFDLTLECIRRYYLGEPSPLHEHLVRYQSFFDLFVDFEGYVDFFLLNDLVAKNNQIKFCLHFNSFDDYILLPINIINYLSYKSNVMRFINNRNNRMSEELDY
jgi:hypothetical protein